jgi:UDP-N-acetylglucosamine acyltransferase
VSIRPGIHPSAVIAAGAVIPETCEVGPFCTIGPEVVLGEECRLISHVVLDGRTQIGARNTFYPFCSVGVPPQDLKYKGEPTQTLIGDDNTIREGVTISRGTAGGGGVTRVGSGVPADDAGAHWARLQGGGPVHFGECGDAGRARCDRRSCDRWCVQPGASVLHGGQVCVYRRRNDCDDGRAAVFEDVIAAGEQGVRREFCWFAAARVYRGAHQDAAEGVSAAAVSKLNTTQALEKIKELEGEDAAELAAFLERSERGVIK